MINTSTKCCVLSLIRVVFFASSKKEHDNVFLLTFLLYFFIFQCLDRFSRFIIQAIAVIAYQFAFVHDILFYPALKYQHHTKANFYPSISIRFNVQPLDI